ncbi:hypothetical protein D3C71_1604280 [compost metagenome]
MDLVLGDHSRITDFNITKASRDDWDISRRSVSFVEINKLYTDGTSRRLALTDFKFFQMPNEKTIAGLGLLGSICDKVFRYWVEDGRFTTTDNASIDGLKAHQITEELRM